MWSCPRETRGWKRGCNWAIRPWACSTWRWRGSNPIRLRITPADNWENARYLYACAKRKQVSTSRVPVDQFLQPLRQFFIRRWGPDEISRWFEAAFVGEAGRRHGAQRQR